MKHSRRLFACLAASLCLLLGGSHVSAAEYTAFDLVLLKRHLAGYTDLTSGSDINGDGKINLADLVRMKKEIAAQNDPEEYTPGDNETPFIPD